VDDVPAIQDLEALAELAAGRSFLLPGLDCQACGFASCRHLAALIVAGLAGPDQCQALASPVDIQVNGRPLALNPFAARIIGSAVRAMLAELKDYSPGQTVLTLRS
jgi:molybdopterin-guanine dinucleotide biosynthesis protein B